MKTNLLYKSFFIICALMFASFSSAQAATINSTYAGPIGGNWNDPANWSPNTVPNNNGTDTFNVSVDSEYPGVTLDVDVNLNSPTEDADGFLGDTGDGSQPHVCCYESGREFC